MKMLQIIGWGDCLAEHPKAERGEYFNRHGSALLVVLLVMTAVTILGIMSLNTSTVEMRIARNERDARETFYLAEGVAMEGVQRLMDTQPINLEEKSHFWHHARKEIEADEMDFRDPKKWDVDGQEEDNGLQSLMDQGTFIAAVEWDLATGSSALVTESRLYMTRVYGLCTKNKAEHLIEIGFYMRY